MAFRPVVSLGTGRLPLIVGAADLDRNGFADVVAWNGQDDTVSAILSYGDGGFSPQVVSSSGAMNGATLGDFNGDGLPDLAVAGYSGNAGLMPGQGDASFGPLQPLDFGSAPWDFAQVDLNRDGQPDLVVANASSLDPTAILATSLRDGGFTLASTPTTGLVERLVAADFDEDGYEDLFALSPYAGCLMPGYADGGFGRNPDVALGRQNWSVAAADFNLDGHVDLAVLFANTSPPYDYVIEVRLGDGHGQFGPPLSWVLPDYPQALLAVDVDGDGLADLVTTNPNSGVVLVYKGGGDGTFESPLSLWVGGDPGPLVVADFNSDGRPDIAAADPNGNRVGVLFNASTCLP